ncbi:MAG: CapA family protein [Pseudoflavonifractor sp.]|nr:CapA family protein [Pseudoflavonifractor sp.]
MTLLSILLFSLMSLIDGFSEEAEILFAGDAMQHQGQLDAARRAIGVYDYSGCFDAVAPYIKGADYAVVNLETPLGYRNFSGYPCFNAPASYAKALHDAGFDLMLTANNHCLDRRDAGVHNTIAILDSLDIPHLGTYRNQRERQTALPLIIDIKGFKTAFLNYTYGTNGITIQGDAVVDYIDRELIAADIKAARTAGAELVAVCIHWGNEYQLLPHPSQKRLADALTDMGVDMIIGSHPHVIQPMEIRHSETHDKDVLLVYSLGNFISNMKTRDTRGGAIVRVRVHRDHEGTPRIKDADYRLVFTVPGIIGKTNYRLMPVEEVSASAPDWTSRSAEFNHAATAIFNRHNIRVPRDTTSRPSPTR